MSTLREVHELGPLRSRARRVLAVFPHPDDESYGCAGLLAREGARPDAATALLCLTRGEASSVGRGQGLARGEIGDLRERRLEEVAAILALDALLVPGLPDGRLAREPLDEVADVIGRAVDALGAQVVIGHDPRGVNGHPDHIASHWAIRHALLSRPGVLFAMIVYTQETCDAIRPRLLFATPEDEIDVTLALTPAETEAKEACLRVHDALVTLREDASTGDDLIWRPAVEHYDLFARDRSPPLAELPIGAG